MSPTSLTCRPHLRVCRLHKATLPSRIKSPVPGSIRAATSGTGPAAKLNRVVFTIPWKVQFGQSLCVSGQGEELGQWNPDKSLPLKWNDGDIWAAEIPLPSGQKVEYKYVVREFNGTLQAWQPGGNCAVAVPTASDGSLQVADDWHGKSRSVIFKNGHVESAPTGTFDGPPAQASSATPPSTSDSSTISSSSSSNSRAGEEPARQVSASTPQLVTGPQAKGLQQIDEPVNKTSDHTTDDSSVGETTGATLEALTVKDLKGKLKGRGRKVSGSKAQLVDRLAAADTPETIE